MANTIFCYVLKDIFFGVEAVLGMSRKYVCFITANKWTHNEQRKVVDRLKTKQQDATQLVI